MSCIRLVDLASDHGIRPNVCTAWHNEESMTQNYNFSILRKWQKHVQGIYTYWKIQYNEFLWGGKLSQISRINGHLWNFILEIFTKNIIITALENYKTFAHQKVGIGQFMKNFSLENNPPHGGSIAAPVQYIFITCPVKNGSQSYLNTMYAVTVVVGGCTNVSCTVCIKH